jgi:hypothetical protein
LIRPVGQAIVFRGLPTQTTKGDRLRHHPRSASLQQFQQLFLHGFAVNQILKRAVT